MQHEQDIRFHGFCPGIPVSDSVRSDKTNSNRLSRRDPVPAKYSNVLPSVVEIDVTETRKVPVNNFFKGFPFFGMPETEEGTKEYEETGLGSGVIVKRTGNTIYALTNFHVAGKASKIKVKLNDEREFEGKLVGGDERIDIALVSFESNDQSIVISKLGDSDVVQQGDIVLALGSPLGYFASVTQGIVSATGRSGDRKSVV